MFKTLRNWTGLLADLVAVGGFLGVSGALVATGLFVLLGWLTKVPWFYIAVFAPLGTAGLLVLLDRYRRPKAVRELVEQWRNHESYSAWIAACLWTDLEPSPQINEKHKAYPKLQMIKSALAAGQIKSLYGDTGVSARVSRAELLKLAEQRKEWPKFLFPDR